MGCQFCLMFTMCEDWIKCGSRATPLDCLQGLYLRTNQKYKVGWKRKVVGGADSSLCAPMNGPSLTRSSPAGLPRWGCEFPSSLSYLPFHRISLARWPLINCCQLWTLRFSHSNLLAKQSSGRDQFNDLPKVTSLISKTGRSLDNESTNYALPPHQKNFTDG